VTEYCVVATFKVVIMKDPRTRKQVLSMILFSVFDLMIYSMVGDAQAARPHRTNGREVRLECAVRRDVRTNLIHFPYAKFLNCPSI
jgi:hypothetical protein